MADFVVQYDVAMPDVAGDVQIYNGYFVHYFAPRGLPPIQKDVVFVIDVSGSMYGTKMRQTKKAMQVILSDLHQDDYFNIITFSDAVNVWKPGQSLQATSQNVRKAKDYVSKMEADGWTDINAALLAAASIFNRSFTPVGKATREQRIPLIIFLTDGEPTSGVTAGSRILANAQQALRGTVSLFGLAFGDDADYGLLRRLSLENRGVARRIYEDADATLQLKGFYDEIASPLLYDVELSYLDGVAQDLTRNLFPNYFQGSELVVAGRVKAGASELRVHTTGQGQEGPLNLENDISANTTEVAPFGCVGDAGQIGHFVQRLWAYFTIQDLLQARFRANDTAARRLLTEKATNLSLKYNFVTPVTSLIVVRPEEEREKGQPAKATGGTRVLKATQPSRTSASPGLSRVAKTMPGLGVTHAPVGTRALKGTVGPAVVPTALVPVTATGAPKAARPTSLPVSALTTTTTTSHISPLLTTTHTKAAKFPPVPGVAAASLAPAIIHGSPKPPRATASVRATRVPVKPPKPSPTRVGRLRITAQPQETRGTAITKVLGGTASTVLDVPTTVYSLGDAKVLGNQSGGGGQYETTPKPATEQQPRIPWQGGATKIGTIPWNKTMPKGGTVVAAGTEKPPQNTTLPWGTVPGAASLPPQGTELTNKTPSAMPASNIIPLLLPGESELLTTTDLGMEYVESLNPPAVYSFVTVQQQPDGVDYEEYSDFLEEREIDSGQLTQTSDIFTFTSWVDGDPHFVVHLPHSLGDLCFTLDGGPGDVLSLVSDPQAGLEVNGHLMGAPLRPGHEERPRTYLDAISMVVDHPRAAYTVNVTREGMTLHGEDALVLPFTQRAVIQRTLLAISVWPEANVTIWIGPQVEFLILLHRYSHPTALQLDHLGFYIVNGAGLSASVHGLLGQFQNGDFRLSQDPARGKQETWLWRGAHKVPVTEVTKVLKDSSRRAHEAPCWLVKRKDVEGLLGGPYSSFLASHLLEM